MGKARLDFDSLRRVYAATPETWSRAKRTRVAAQGAGCSVGSIARALAGRGSTSGSTKIGKPSGHGYVMTMGHSAARESRTLFPGTVRPPDEDVLKPGEYSAKLGSVIAKGPFRGRAIYSLSLEERASCPSTCAHWLSCYGNNMPQAKRYAHGAELERRLPLEVGAKLLKNPGGIAVRLHTLGDFYSWRYVYLWRELVEMHEGLMVFGFTAHNDPARDPVARALVNVVRELWPRFAVRFSNGLHTRLTTVSVERPEAAPPDAVVCPSQWTTSGKTASTCGDCGLCWHSTRRIAFLRH